MVLCGNFNTMYGIGSYREMDDPNYTRLYKVVQCKMYNVECTIYIVHCTICRADYTIYIIQCILYT